MFDRGLREIERAYTAARQEFESDQKYAGEKWDEFEASGKDSIIKDPVSGQEFDYEMHLIDINEMAEDGLRMIREAFVLVAYHYWEKQVIGWSKISRYEYKKAYAWLERNNFPVQKDTLEVMRETANCIKHDAGRLHDIEPNMFDAGEVSRFGSTPSWHDALRVEDQHMTEFFDALRKSGPTTTSTFDK